MRILICGLPTGNGDLEFYIDTNVNQRVDDIKGIVSYWIHGGCEVAGELSLPFNIPKSHWAVHSHRRATPWNMPTKYLVEEDLPLVFSLHEWTQSYQQMHLWHGTPIRANLTRAEE